MRITQQDIADKAGMTRSMVSELFSGRRELSVKTARRFAKVLDTTPGRVIDMDLGDLESAVKTRLAKDGLVKDVRAAVAEAAAKLNNEPSNSDRAA